MILVADSGATKTDWIKIDKKNSSEIFQTSGINPNFIDEKGIYDLLCNELLPHIQEKISEIYFHGAGCSSDENKNKISETLKKLFPETKIEIYTDLHGAAIALCGDQSGIACILGTGSNSCLFDGKKIINKATSLGYILGDEGSGAHLGKTLLKAYLTKELPIELSELFYQKYKIDQTEIIQTIYNKPFPNRFLASFSYFLSENINHPFINQMVKNCFHDFFKYYILIYPEHKDLPVHFTGSIAHIFSELLIQCSLEYKIQINKIIQSPIEGLQEYYQKIIRIA